MAPRYLVRGETSVWFLIGRVVGPLTMLAAIALWMMEPIAAVVIFVTGLLITLVMETTALLNRFRRRWVEVDDDGFLVIDSRGERRYGDDQVHSIAYSVKNNYMNGDLKGFTRRCTLWLVGEPQPLGMENRFKTGQADPLGPFFDRLIDLLYDGFNSALEHGHALQGDGWRLTQQELVFRRGSREESLPVAEITAVESREGKMGVWRKGQDEPCVRFPIDGRNVWLLNRLVTARISEEQRDEASAGSALGRVLFQRRPGMGTVVGVALLGVVGIAVGIGLLVGGRDLTMELIGGAVILLSPLFFVGSYGCAKSNFRCHERGVYQTGIFGEKRLMYSEVAAFSYGATRHYHNGVYTGTNLSLQFDPVPGTKSGPISYSTQVKNDDADLDELRDFVAGVIANRMRNDVANGATVPWTKNMIFRPEGIEYTPSGFFGRKQTSLIPHDQYGGWNMDQGVFYLFQQGHKNAVMTEQVSEKNFWPGFFLLLALYHQEQEASAVAQS